MIPEIEFGPFDLVAEAVVQWSVRWTATPAAWVNSHRRLLYSVAPPHKVMGNQREVHHPSKTSLLKPL